jgi:hypothetical protein
MTCDKKNISVPPCTCLDVGKGSMQDSSRGVYVEYVQSKCVHRIRVHGTCVRTRLFLAPTVPGSG